MVCLSRALMMMTGVSQEMKRPHRKTLFFFSLLCPNPLWEYSGMLLLKEYSCQDASLYPLPFNNML